MTIDPKQAIEGIPILKVRDVLRSYRNHLNASSLAEGLGITGAKAKRLLNELKDRGFVEAGEAKDYLELTQTGSRFASASGTPPITRSTANRLLSEVLNRITELNKREELAYWVPRAAVFGSFLSDAERLGDLDIAFEMKFRTDVMSERHDVLQRRIRESGRTFGSFIDEQLWPSTEVRRLVKGGHGAISLHEWSELERLKTPAVEFYPSCSDPTVGAAIKAGRNTKKPAHKRRRTPARFRIMLDVYVDVADPRELLLIGLREQDAQGMPDDHENRHQDATDALGDLAFTAWTDAVELLPGVVMSSGSSHARKLRKDEREL